VIPVPVSSTDETLQRVASIFPPPMSGTLLPCLRLDTTISPANTRPNPYREEVVLGDLLPSPASPDPAVLAEARAVSDAIDEVLATLDERARAVIELRFGFAGPPLTLEQIGRRFDVTRERIRQIEAKALKAIAPRLAAALGMPLPGRAGVSTNGAGPGPGAPPRALHAPHRPAVPVPAAAFPRPGPPVVPSPAQADRPPAARPLQPGPPPPPVSLRLPPSPRPAAAPAPAPASAEDRIFRALLEPWQHVPPPEPRRPAVRPPETPPPPPPPPARAPESPGLAAGLPLDAWLADWQARGFTVIDDRPCGGSVWVRDAGMALAAEIEHLRREGTWFRFAENRSLGAWGWFLVRAS
jgi:RNA polymerase sigma factor (sigma-70 family)